MTQKIQIILLTLLLTLLNTIVFSQDLLQGNLIKGKYEVGFKRVILIDSSRSNTHVKSEDNRPVIVNIWYPAKTNNSEKVKFDRYINFDDDKIHKTLAKKLNQFNRKMVRICGFDKRRNILNINERAAYKKLLSLETMAVENAPAIEGEVFPLIVNHPGAGGPVVDNHVFFEHLASYGYVVCNAVYQAGPENEIYVGWNLEASIPDMDIIIETARQENYVSQDILGLMGHSVGGDLCLAYVSKGKYKPNAIITLDINFGYCEDYLGEGNVTELLNLFWAHLEKYNVPMLNTASLVHFPVLDSLIYCPRTYIEISKQKHEQFTSLGIIGRRLETIKEENKGTFKIAEENFESLVNYCRNYLDFHLKGKKSDHTELPTESFKISHLKTGENPTSGGKIYNEIDIAILERYEGIYSSTQGKKVYTSKVYVDN